jgi:hypothetical protein
LPEAAIEIDIFAGNQFPHCTFFGVDFDLALNPGPLAFFQLFILFQFSPVARSQLANRQYVLCSLVLAVLEKFKTVKVALEWDSA